MSGKTPFALGRIFGLRSGTWAIVAGFVFLQLGFEGIAPLSWRSPDAVCIWGGLQILAGLTWNGLAYALEHLEGTRP